MAPTQNAGCFTTRRAALPAAWAPSEPRSRTSSEATGERSAAEVEEGEEGVGAGRWGGGAAEAWELFIGPMRDEIARRAYSEPAKRAKLVPAALGDDAGLLGAARLAFLDRIK